MISIEEHVKVLEELKSYLVNEEVDWEESGNSCLGYITIALKQLEVRKAQQGKLK